MKTDIDIITIGTFYAQLVHELDGNGGTNALQHRSPSGNRLDGERCCAPAPRCDGAGPGPNPTCRLPHTVKTWGAPRAAASTRPPRRGHGRVDFGFQAVGRLDADGTGKTSGSRPETETVLSIRGADSRSDVVAIPPRAEFGLLPACRQEPPGSPLRPVPRRGYVFPGFPGAGHFLNRHPRCPAASDATRPSPPPTDA
ncbi:MAG: hypothetical protein FD153_311 [Rhodospirillaceae bacterium]|nr:MAG: hypothetical protein FD153_311 [Rhodospirillaceae bacterium]